jgi:pantoate--beta-alanine ligase
MLVHTIDEVREQIKDWTNVGLVPTMGALHAGHRLLIEASIAKCDKTVVSIFVNPTQFGPNEDFDRYPRTLEADLELCAGADLVFAPSVQEMYTGTTTVVPPEEYANILCGKSRPGHFNGVCTVVSKLFNIIQPDFAFFGEKDRQQLIIIKKMTVDLNFPIEIIGCPIVRAENGLALSSRNKYLTPGQNPPLYKILSEIKSCYNNGMTDVKAFSADGLEYLEFRDENDLHLKEVADDDTIVFAAMKMGDVRLIDNMELK